jgi:hypothetical protein
MNIHLVMFMTHKYGRENYYFKGIKALIESSKQYGVEHFHIYTPNMLPVAKHVLKFMEDNLDTGFGFYSWKPLVILDVMKNIKEGDVVLYHDSGRPEYGFSFKKDINILVNNVINNYNGIGIAQGNYKNYQYCKKDCFITMDCNEEKYWNLNHLSATWSVWEKSPLSLEILNKWKQWNFDPSGIITDENSISDFTDYVGHRHDQSILTNLIFQYHFNNNNIKPIYKSVYVWEKDINNYID